jgi:hypothetical protein
MRWHKPPLPACRAQKELEAQQEDEKLVPPPPPARAPRLALNRWSQVPLSSNIFDAFSSKRSTHRVFSLIPR